MYIVILGAGDVGSSIATNLVLENNDITIVDNNPTKLEKLHARLDIQTVCGGASYPDVLIAAGIQEADMLIAVTNSDEINMIACQIAYTLFKTPLRIARIRSSHYASPKLYSNHHIPVDVRINPEQLVTTRLMRLINFPGTEDILDFYHGDILLASISFPANHPLVNASLDTICAQIQDLNAFPVAIYQKKTIQAIQNDSILKTDDIVFFLTTPYALHQITERLGQNIKSNYRIIIGGGGHIGAKLARNLEAHYQVKIIEKNIDVANQLASYLNHSFVLEGDIADCELLLSENIQDTDVFCAVTNEDEANIMSCLQAKHLGVKHAIALINRKTYVPLIENSPIDHAISPELITVGHILTKVRRGHMLKVHRLQNTNSEMIELVLLNQSEQSNVIDKRLSEIPLPKNCFIVGVIREGELIEPLSHFKFQKHDHLIILMIEQNHLDALERLFQLND
jgi:trk system potassium uptake protein TrkA